jgi:hypothetical protein
MESTIACTACGGNLHRCETSERGKRRRSETVMKPPVENGKDGYIDADC